MIYLCQNCGEGYQPDPAKPKSFCFCSDDCTTAYRARTGREWPPIGGEIPLDKMRPCVLPVPEPEDPKCPDHT